MVIDPTDYELAYRLGRSMLTSMKNTPMNGKKKEKKKRGGSFVFGCLAA